MAGGTSRHLRSGTRWILVSVVAVLAVGFLAMRQASGARKLVLPGGSVVVLKGVTFGTNHYSSPAWFYRSLGWVPDPIWQRLVGGTPLKGSRTASPSLGLRLGWAGQEERNSRLMFALTDTEGVEPLGSKFVLSWSPEGAGAFWTPPICPATPDQLLLKVYRASEGSSWTPAGTMAFANPARRHAARWIAMPLPAAQKAGKGEVILESLELRFPGQLGDAAFVEERRTAAVAEVAWRMGGVESVDVPLDQVEVVDGLGHSRTLRRSAAFERPAGGGAPVVMIPEEEALIVHGPGRARFVWPYWLSDPAYLLRMEWRPGPSAWLPPDDEWWLRGVRVPEMEGVTLLAGESMLHGRRAQALALVGEHATLPGREHDVMGLTTLEISMDGTLPEGLRFTVMDAVDDRGRRVPVQEVVVGRSIGLVLKPSARTVDIRLGVYRRIRAEWCVAPRLVTGGTK